MFKGTYSEKSFIQYIAGRHISGKLWIVFIVFIVWRLLMIWISFGVSRPISILAIFINLPFLVVLGGLEELGWRGILQPKLENLISYIPSIILVSLIWSLFSIELIVSVILAMIFNHKKQEKKMRLSYKLQRLN